MREIPTDNYQLIPPLYGDGISAGGFFPLYDRQIDRLVIPEK